MKPRRPLPYSRKPSENISEFGSSEKNRRSFARVWRGITAIDFRAYLLTERKLSLKSCRNIIDATLELAAVMPGRLITCRRLDNRDPFKAGRPDPFTEEDCDNIIDYFETRISFYFPLVYTLFFTGMRPSEALALRWRDIDFNRREISISKSVTGHLVCRTKFPDS